MKYNHTDIESLVIGFEARTLPKDQWTHEAHLVVAIWHAFHNNQHDALELVRTKITRYNEATGTANTNTSGYHETLTRFWLTVAFRFMRFHHHQSVEEYLDSILNSPLANKNLPLEFYSQDFLFTPQCRLTWREPDLRPLTDLISMIDTSVQPHFVFSDIAFEESFRTCMLNPALFSHEAHLRLAWVHLMEYGEDVAIQNICDDLMRFVQHNGDAGKFNKTLTVAAVKVVNHFMQRSSTDNFYDFIHEFPRLKTSFKELMASHYEVDIFNSEMAKKVYLEPDRLPFDQGIDLLKS